jgi:hypothetical protein
MVISNGKRSSDNKKITKKICFAVDLPFENSMIQSAANLKQKKSKNKFNSF